MSDSASTPAWVKYIENRIELAREWRDELPEHQKLAELYRYVRIRGKDFRAISIGPKNPCGRLIRKDNDEQVEGEPNIRAAIQSAYNAFPYGDPKDYKPNRHKAADPDTDAKPEHRMQAFLIRHALMNGQKLHGVLKGFENTFDELVFITDELSTGKLRADIIAMGRKGERHFPVFIELKMERELTRLREQLEGAKNLMNLAGEPFIAMLSAISGVPKEKISFEGYQLMSIWRSTKTGREHKSVEAARSDALLPLLFAEYLPLGDAYTFTRN